MICYAAFLRKTGLAASEKAFLFWLFHTEKLKRENES